MVKYLEKIKKVENAFNKFVTTLTPPDNQDPVSDTRQSLAKGKGYPGLQSWLQSDDSNKIGIVEADWWGGCYYITYIIQTIAEKNRKIGNFA